MLGDLGHLSNRQAAELTAAIAGRSGEGFPAHLVQLHLSRDCNKPELAQRVMHKRLQTLGATHVQLNIADQKNACPTLTL